MSTNFKTNGYFFISMYQLGWYKSRGTREREEREIDKPEQDGLLCDLKMESRLTAVRIFSF